MGRILAIWPISGLALTLSLLSLALVYSATWQALDPPGPYFSKSFWVQLIALGLALLLFRFVRTLKWNIRPGNWIWGLYGGCALLLLIVLIPGIGGDNPAHSWINLGPVNFQPSEFCKVAFVLFVAWLFTSEAPVTPRTYYFGLGLTAVLIGLVMIEPDLGTAMVFVFTFFVMALISRVPLRHILATIIAFALLAVPSYFFIMLPHQQLRVKTFFNPDLDPQGAGYQVNQSEIAIGSGGLWGKGFMRGTQSQGNFVPVQSSDFIFSLVGEEFGFAGCFIVLLLYFLLLANMLALGRSCHLDYERYVCFGAAAVIMFHVYVSAGMTMRISPMTGIPLPFLSYGGSALLAMWMLIAILEAIQTSLLRVQRPGRA